MARRVGEHEAICQGCFALPSLWALFKFDDSVSCCCYYVNFILKFKLFLYLCLSFNHSTAAKFSSFFSAITVKLRLVQWNWNFNYLENDLPWSPPYITHIFIIIRKEDMLNHTKMKNVGQEHLRFYDEDGNGWKLRAFFVAYKHVFPWQSGP